ncbi:GreA/GreB family elongation factor [Marinobacterium arenosum]|uniref:GreA/GreB family elongation factor n=1 Tax=Marinobacterium arenosum TaxID=2862496 RepID=UPI001C93E6CF|nr:GreA/GreB family elongation factor [Marinobacterium arenosum]MBY4678429.1 GreA/GreB family elongation factor [Marinobacterium arenosum]
MDKQALIAQILDQLERQLQEALQAADEAHQNATHSESQAETQYDTLGLENAYLAHGQSMRVEALQQALACYRQLPLPEFSPQMAIGIGALVQVEDDERQSLYLIGPLAGGMQLQLDGQPVRLVTPESPIGTELIGKQLGDEVRLRRAGQELLAEITDLQ